ncbi:hypothetical protein CPLU01_10030 [Colletotrichum plurivorum]|uniref:UMTA methyltransferase n=1 Tax=Colletotrichum plurivorum TaxID=2175906 RepID=A0A8H6K7J2_9PEZI|nr:hypothetical protein CPLU01_10030 [Colletotrichum plurivorum]
MEQERVPDKDWKFTNGRGYVVNREHGHAAVGRLNLQFYLWNSALQFNIHPSLKSLLSSISTIAEVASGNAIWLIDVARELPEVQLDGFDYDSRQCPHQHWFPPNVRVRYLNIIEGISDNLVGKYDYVHTRLLILVVNPDLPTPGLDELHKCSWAGGRHDWTVKLADFVAEEGFVRDGLELARAFRDQHLQTAEEFAEGLAKLGNKEAAARHFRIVEEAYKESVSGAALSVTKVVATARKPL